MAEIIIKENGKIANTFLLKKKLITIGRSYQCDIRLNGKDVSSLHANIVAIKDGYQLIDMDSTNGVFLNGTKIEEELLKDGNEILIGNHILNFSIEERLDKTIITKINRDDINNSTETSDKIKSSSLVDVLAQTGNFEAGNILKKSISNPNAEDVTGISEPMQYLFNQLEKVAVTDITLLITGETGTGKSLIAKTTHYLSSRKEKELVTIDCASIPSELLESELFGYEKGAFTGAVKQKKGRIEYAEGGTLFLDEIGDMPLNLQAKLLRLLQDKSFERVGGTKTHYLDVRVITATNRDLEELVKKKIFREDLYYRLNGITLHMPALRDRGEDIFILANIFLERVKQANKLNIKGFTPECKNRLLHFAWNGNVRQLKNVVQRAAILAEHSYIRPEDINIEPTTLIQTISLKKARETVDKKLIRNQLVVNKGNMSQTAKVLEIDRSTLRELVSKYGIVVEREK